MTRKRPHQHYRKIKTRKGRKRILINKGIKRRKRKKRRALTQKELWYIKKNRDIDPFMDTGLIEDITFNIVKSPPKRVQRRALFPMKRSKFPLMEDKPFSSGIIDEEKLREALSQQEELKQRALITEAKDIDKALKYAGVSKYYIDEAAPKKDYAQQAQEENLLRLANKDLRRKASESIRRIEKQFLRAIIKQKSDEEALRIYDDPRFTRKVEVLRDNLFESLKNARELKDPKEIAKVQKLIDTFDVIENQLNKQIAKRRDATGIISPTLSAMLEAGRKGLAMPEWTGPPKFQPKDLVPTKTWVESRMEVQESKIAEKAHDDTINYIEDLYQTNKTKAKSELKNYQRYLIAQHKAVQGTMLEPTIKQQLDKVRYMSMAKNFPTIMKQIRKEKEKEFKPLYEKFDKAKSPQEVRKYIKKREKQLEGL